ncbi:MAG: glycosyltransferase family 2 protein, partial [Methylococcaceae bacterium]
IENVDSCAELKQDAIGFKRALTQRNYYIGLLHQNLAQHHETITALKKVSEVMQADIATLNQGLLERDSQVRALAQTIDEKNNALQEMHLSATQQNYRLKKIRRSYAWQVFKPLRMVNNLFSSFLYGINVNLTPLSQLTAKGNNWQAAGDDAQFLLITDRAWRNLGGWHWLEVKIFSAQPLKAQLFFDRGQGFDSVGVINFQINGNGLQRIPIFIPYQCTGIRFDPCDMPASFKLSHLVLKRLKDAPRLPAEFLAQAIVYEALGGRQGNASVLEPVADVQLNPDGDYCWRSESDDPWFAVTNIKSKLSPGWYVFEIAVNADPKYGNARLYFDYGEGYSEPCSVEIPYKDGRVYKRFYKLTATPRQIRFDPADRSAKFSIKRIHFFPVPAIAANYFMLRRLRNRVIQYKDQPLPQIWRALGIQAKKENIAARELLLEAYNKTFISNGLTSALVYSDWIDKTEKPEFDDLAAIDIVQKFLKTQPTVSIVMPVYNTAELYLRKAIDSVLAQSYPNWELCIADDASPAPDVKVVLEEYRQRDSRIKVVYRQQNGHISAASNSALELATGEYVALLDHDDELAVHALHFIVEAINHNPSAQILYSDEDKIDKDGNRSEPHFKSDWNPDLFFSQNYVSHLGVYRRDLLIKINGFRTSVEGSQDQDLLLRCLPFVKSVDIVHIPKVLYHWRALEGSTALDSGEKSYTTDAGIKALQDYFKAQGKDDVKVEMGLVPNTYRVRYGIPEPEPLISLLIPTRDMLAVLEPCIRSIIDKTTYQNYEIIILDNGSIETSTREYFKSIQAEDSRVKVVPYNYPFNYSAINNFGVKQAKGELIGLINNDVEVISPEWLTEMVSHALRPEIGCVGAKLYYDDETIQHAGVIVGLGGVAGHSHKYFPRAASGYFHRLKITQNLSAVTAACLIVRKAIFEQVGGLEEEGLRVAFNDVDFCLKVREAGYRNLWTPYAELYHHESKSRGAEDTPEKIERFNKEIDFIKNKWGTILQNDPYYSRNLTLNREDFSL